MWTIVRHLSITAAGLSVFMLLHQGWEFGVAAPIEAMVEFYGAALRVLLGWADPFISEVLVRVNGLFATELKVRAHWRPIFVLMFVFFGVLARESNRTNLAVSLGMWFAGLLLSLLVGLGSGAFIVSRRPSFTTDAVLIAVLPIVALVGYCFLRGAIERAGARQRSWAGFLGNDWARLGFALSLTFGTLLYLFAIRSIWVRPFALIDGWSIWLATLAILFAGAYLIVAAAFRVGIKGFPRVGWWGRVGQDSQGRVGLGLMAVFAAALFFVVTNAGLKLAGL